MLTCFEVSMLLIPRGVLTSPPPRLASVKAKARDTSETGAACPDSRQHEGQGPRPPPTRQPTTTRRTTLATPTRVEGAHKGGTRRRGLPLLNLRDADMLDLGRGRGSWGRWRPTYSPPSTYARATVRLPSLRFRTCVMKPSWGELMPPPHALPPPPPLKHQPQQHQRT